MVSCEALTPGEIRAQGEGVALRHGYAATPLGETLFGWTPRGLCHIAFVDDAVDDDTNADAGLAVLHRDWPAANFIRDDAGAMELATRIFPATPTPGRLHLLLRGTNFQIKVWEALLKIPPASMVSYGQLAGHLGQPRAAGVGARPGCLAAHRCKVKTLGLSLPQLGADSSQNGELEISFASCPAKQAS